MLTLLLPKCRPHVFIRPAVDLLGREYRRRTSEQTGAGLAAVTVFTGDGDFLVEDDERGFLALADLCAGLGVGQVDCIPVGIKPLVGFAPMVAARSTAS